MHPTTTAKGWVRNDDGSAYVMSGPNVVVKASPYLPAVEGNTICNDVVNDECTATGTCVSCYTFNQADVDHIKSLGWNSIRLGVVWAGAQPTDSDELDADFLERLHAVLNLTDANDIQVWCSAALLLDIRALSILPYPTLPYPRHRPAHTPMTCATHDDSPPHEPHHRTTTITYAPARRWCWTTTAIWWVPKAAETACPPGFSRKRRQI